MSDMRAGGVVSAGDDRVESCEECDTAAGSDVMFISCN